MLFTEEYEGNKGGSGSLSM